MKTNLPILLVLLSALFILNSCGGGCNNEPKIKDGKEHHTIDSNKSNVQNDKQKQNAVSDTPIYISVDSANYLVEEMIDSLRHNIAKRDHPKLEDNVIQYIFSVNNFKIADDDTWYIHKAYDADSKYKVCFILEVLHSGVAGIQYYKGIVDCPSICGYDEGGLKRRSVKYYNRHPLNELISDGLHSAKEIAQGYMTNQQLNCIHTIQISQNIVYQIAHKDNTAFIEIAMVNNGGNYPNALVYCVDKSGFSLGKVADILPRYFCIYDGNHQCELLP